MHRLALALLPLALTTACTRPPPPIDPAVRGNTAGGAHAHGDCDDPAQAAFVETCADDPAGPSGRRPERPGEDRDGDGIEDIFDVCLDDPEDLDGFDDEDGCPEPGGPGGVTGTGLPTGDP
jgi:hypothetical protein